MKAYCKRTVINENSNKIRWSRDKYYQTKTPDDYELNNGVYMYVIVEDHKKLYYPLSKKDFDRYFIGVDEIRNNKIKQILDE